jgi:hypothetical protein
MRTKSIVQFGGSAPKPPGFSAIRASPYQFSTPPAARLTARPAAYTVQAPQSALGLHPCIALSSAAARTRVTGQVPGEQEIRAMQGLPP